MKLTEAVKQFKDKNTVEELTSKRFACANCGATWVELAGLVVSHGSGKEDLHMRIGLESEECETCRMRSQACQECGSKDVYELRFEKTVPDVPLNFNAIKTISKASKF